MKPVLRVVVGALLGLALAGCHAPADQGKEAPAFQLKLYEVPVAQSRSIAGHLQSVLENSDYLVGLKSHTEMTVSQPFPGAVLVLAPEALQPSIGSAIKAMAEASANGAHHAQQSVPLRVQFWVVQAKAGTGNGTPALNLLAGTLKQIGSTLGPSHFVLEDTASALVDAPDHPDTSAGFATLSTSRGHTFRFHATANADADAGIALDVNFATAGGEAGASTMPELKTTITLRSGEYVVLAEAPPAPDSSTDRSETLMSMIVVRVDRLDPKKH